VLYQVKGLVQTALKNYQKAIDSYIEAHKVHPNMKSPLIMIEKLKLQIKKRKYMKNTFS
jgi:hypothetical protein